MTELSPQSEMKQCIGVYGCGEWKLIDEFPRNKANRDGHQSPCLPCCEAKNRAYRTDPEHGLDRLKRHNERQRAYYAASPDSKRAANLAYARTMRGKQQRFASHLRNAYGLTLESWWSMLIAQAGRCDVCDTPMTKQREPHLDHCHDTGVLRALLCGSCNVGIGLLQHDTDRLLAAVEYLNRFRATKEANA